MSPGFASLTRLWRGACDLVFPPQCVHCRGLVETEQGRIAAPPSASAPAAKPAGRFRHLCTACAGQIDFIKAPHCSTCGHPFYGEMEGERMCPHCEGLEPAFGRGCAATLYKGPTKSLVLELKYYRGLHVLEDIEEIFRRSPHVLEHVRDAVLVPVPLHPSKQRQRRFNQTALLAEALARAAGGQTRVQHLLRRVAKTASQTGFRRQERMANLKNAFALAPKADLNPALHFILVDDVFTTGSTLNSCARTLRQAGALNTDVVTFGHG